ncbi:MAG TPA: DNA polymerase III subunit beta [Nevskiaceae bacterium]
MHIRASREILLRALQSVIGVVERRQALPILGNLRLSCAEDGALAIQATDLEVQITSRCPVESTEPGSTTAPARKLFDIVRSLPDGADTELQLEEGRLHLQSGRSRFVLATLPAEEFPELGGDGEYRTLKVGAGILKSLISRTQFAMAQQDVRYYLNGLLLEVADGRLRAVATDGHRLAVAEEALGADANAAGQFIVPRKTVQEISRVLDREDMMAGLRLSTSQLVLEADDVTLVSKLVDGKYPEYRRVIPEAGDRKMTADRSRVSRALSRAAILSNEKFRGIRLRFEDNTVRIEAQNPDQEEAAEELEIEYEGAPLEIGFNVNYLVEALNAIEGERFVMEMRGPDASGLIFDPDKPQHQYVVMPMRL